MRLVQENELRLGNCVMWNNTPIKIISEIILMRTFFKIKEGRVTGIPLNPDFLISSCGFKKISNQSLLTPDTRIAWMSHEFNHFGAYSFNLLGAMGIEYLHELQNLYFAVEKKELEVNLYIN